MKRHSSLDQKIDISGSNNPIDNLDLSNESSGIGNLSGKSGTTANIIIATSNYMTLSGLSGFSTVDLGGNITITGADAGNNGIFPIININSPISINVETITGVAPDSHNGHISWIARNPYTLEDDLNFVRTDRANIKGTSYSNPVPTYQRPSNIGTNVPASLANISGKTLDAVGYLMPTISELIDVEDGYTKVILSSSGILKHSDAINKTGVPCIDAVPYLNVFSACYVDIINPIANDHLVVLSGPHSGERIFGLTNGGSSISPNSIEIVFYSAPIGSDISNNHTPYVWEGGQTHTINLTYGFFTQADQLDENAFRSIQVVGLGSLAKEHEALRQLIHLASDGPFEDFFPNMFQELLPSGSPFPTSIIWYDSPSKSSKIISETIAYNPNHTINTYQYKAYDTDGVTILATITDTYSYNGVFITHRTRAVS